MSLKMKYLQDWLTKFTSIWQQIANKCYHTHGVQLLECFFNPENDATIDTNTILKEWYSLYHSSGTRKCLVHYKDFAAFEDPRKALLLHQHNIIFKVDHGKLIISLIIKTLPCSLKNILFGV